MYNPIHYLSEEDQLFICSLTHFCKIKEIVKYDLRKPGEHWTAILKGSATTNDFTNWEDIWRLKICHKPLNLDRDIYEFRHSHSILLDLFLETLHAISV